MAGIDLSELPDQIDLSELPDQEEPAKQTAAIVTNQVTQTSSLTAPNQPQKGLLQRAYEFVTPSIGLREKGVDLRGDAQLKIPHVEEFFNSMADKIAPSQDPNADVLLNNVRNIRASGVRMLGGILATGFDPSAVFTNGADAASTAVRLPTAVPKMVEATEELNKLRSGVRPNQAPPVIDPVINPTVAAAQIEKPDFVKQAEELFKKNESPIDLTKLPDQSTQLKLPDVTPEELATARPEAIQKLTAAIDEGIVKAKEQAKSYTKERAGRFANLKNVTTPGEKGFYQQLGTLKGEYEKLGMPPLREVLDQKDIDSVVDIISAAPIADELTKIHAKSGLVKLLNGQIPQPSELKILNQILGTAIDVPGVAKLPATPSRLRQIYELTRGLKSVDVPFMTSAAFRQGSGLFGTREWLKAFKDQARSFSSERVYDKIMEGVEANPIHQKRVIATPLGQTEFASIADQIGLATSDLKSLSSRDEQIRGIIAEKIPGLGRWIRGSNRSYTAFINSLRTATAENWLKAANLIDNQGRITNVVEASKIANTINELTGAGSLRIAAPFSRFTKSGRELNLQKSADNLSLLFFSPKLMVRDARMMNPLNYMKNDKLVRMKYLEGAVRRAGMWAGFTTLGALAGADVSDNPLSSDFGKVKMGDTRADAGSGLLQWIVLTARQAAGESTSSTSGRTREFGSNAVASTRKDLALDFLINRLHPSLRPIANFAAATKNRPFYPMSEAGESITPFPVADMIELMKHDPEMEQIILGLAASGLSMGSMTYGKSDFGKPTFEVPGDVAFKGGSLTGGR